MFKSFQSSLIAACDKITQLVVSKNTADAIYLDFTEAFDVLCCETTQN